MTTGKMIGRLKVLKKAVLADGQITSSVLCVALAVHVTVHRIVEAL